MNQTLKNLFHRYLKNLVILTVVVGVLTGGIYMITPNLISPILPWFIPYFFIISLAFHYYLLKAAQKDSKKFIPRFMGSNGFKLMIYLITILVLALTIESNPVPFVMGFFILYLFYTVFEVVIFLRQSKQIQN